MSAEQERDLRRQMREPEAAPVAPAAGGPSAASVATLPADARVGPVPASAMAGPGLRVEVESPAADVRVLGRAEAVAALEAGAEPREWDDYCYWWVVYNGPRARIPLEGFRGPDGRAYVWEAGARAGATAPPLNARYLAAAVIRGPALRRDEEQAALAAQTPQRVVATRPDPETGAPIPVDLRDRALAAGIHSVALQPGVAARFARTVLPHQMASPAEYESIFRTELPGEELTYDGFFSGAGQLVVPPGLLDPALVPARPPSGITTAPVRRLSPGEAPVPGTWVVRVPPDRYRLHVDVDLGEGEEMPPHGYVTARGVWVLPAERPPSASGPAPMPSARTVVGVGEPVLVTIPPAPRVPRDFGAEYDVALARAGVFDTGDPQPVPPGTAQFLSGPTVPGQRTQQLSADAAGALRPIADTTRRTGDYVVLVAWDDEAYLKLWQLVWRAQFGRNGLVGALPPDGWVDHQAGVVWLPPR